MDFGIAKVARSGTSSGLTTTGQIMGTPEYMSPEQCLGEKIDSPLRHLRRGDRDLRDLHRARSPSRATRRWPRSSSTSRTRSRWRASVAARIPRPAGARDPPRPRQEPRGPLRLLPRDGGGAAGGPRRSSRPAPASDQLRTGPVPAGSTPTPNRGAPAGHPHRHLRELQAAADGQPGRRAPGGAHDRRERGPGGARVCTTMASLGPGDVVVIEEVGGPKSNGESLHHARRGPQLLPGQGQHPPPEPEFLDRPAPKHLVVEEDAEHQQAVLALRPDGVASGGTRASFYRARGILRPDAMDAVYRSAAEPRRARRPHPGEFRPARGRPAPRVAARGPRPHGRGHEPALPDALPALRGRALRERDDHRARPRGREPEDAAHRQLRRGGERRAACSSTASTPTTSGRRCACWWARTASTTST